MSGFGTFDRRTFLRTCTAGAAAMSSAMAADSTYRVVSSYKRIPGAGMPGSYPGQVVAVHSPKSVDDNTERIDAGAVREMMTRGMLTLTGASDLRQAWGRFIGKNDVVGIKVNCVGRPNVMSSPEVVAEIVRNVNAVGVPLERIHIYERFGGQMEECKYPEKVPAGVHYFGAEQTRGTK